MPQQKRGCHAGWVVPGVRNRGGRFSESTQDRPDEADEKAPKPGEPDTETEGGFPKEPLESKDGQRKPATSDAVGGVRGGGRDAGGDVVPVGLADGVRTVPRC